MLFHYFSVSFSSHSEEISFLPKESFSFPNPIILFSSKRKTHFLSLLFLSIIVSIINYSLGMCEFIFCFREVSSLSLFLLFLSSSSDEKGEKFPESCSSMETVDRLKGVSEGHGDEDDGVKEEHGKKDVLSID